VLAKFITGIPWAALILGDVVTGRAFVVVVINTVFGWLFHFIDGVERVNHHRATLLENKQIYQAAKSTGREMIGSLDK
jgi:fructose-1,6-bisphosphatase/inositol monophosphatase family enzyme